MPEEYVITEMDILAAGIVRAIRRVYGSPDGIGGVEKFTVHNVHEFARRLLEQGVTVSEEAPT